MKKQEKIIPNMGSKDIPSNGYQTIFLSLHWKLELTDTSDLLQLATYMDSVIGPLIASHPDVTGILRRHKCSVLTAFVADITVTKDGNILCVELLLVRELGRENPYTYTNVRKEVAPHLERALSNIKSSNTPGSNFVLGNAVVSFAMCSEISTETEVELVRIRLGERYAFEREVRLQELGEIERQPQPMGVAA